MSAGDVTAGVDHDHQRGADGERRNHTRNGADYRATDSKNKEEGPDKFCDVFIHKLEVLMVSLFPVWLQHQNDLSSRRPRAFGFGTESIRMNPRSGYSLSRMM